MIVINVDTAGNGRAGASSKCTEAGNEPHRFFKVSAVSWGSCRDWNDWTSFFRQVLPTAGSWMQTHSSLMPWGGPALLPAGTWPWGAGGGPSSVSVLARLWGDSGYSSIQPKGVFAGC